MAYPYPYSLDGHKVSVCETLLTGRQCLVGGLHVGVEAEKTNNGGRQNGVVIPGVGEQMSEGEQGLTTAGRLPNCGDCIVAARRADMQL